MQTISGVGNRSYRMMLTSAAPMTVSAASKAKAPAKVSITSVKRVNNTKANVKWKKLKKAPSGYAIYQKTGSKGWKLVKKASKKLGIEKEHWMLHSK